MRLVRKIFLSVIALSILILCTNFLFYKPHDSKISEKTAVKISEDMFADYISRTGVNKSQFSNPTIENMSDGWDFSYNLKSDQSRRIGIFIDKYGKGDYSEAP